VSLQVRVIGRKSSYKGKEYTTFYVNIPSAFAKILKISENDILNCTIIDTEINGKKVRGILYFKP